MKRTAVLVISDGTHTEKWVGPITALVSASTDYKKADLPLAPTARLFSSRAIGFQCTRSWFSFTRGELYEQVFFFTPRLLSELAKNYARFEDTLCQSQDFRPLREYEHDDRINQSKLEELLKRQLSS